MALAADTDVLVHDAQFTAAELPQRAFLGHSAVEYAIGLACAARSRRVLLYHHDPSRTDDELDAIVASHQHGPVGVEAAAEGMVLDLPGLPAPVLDDAAHGGDRRQQGEEAG